MLLLVIGSQCTIEKLSAGQFILTILYDNYVYEQGTTADWGFSCLVKEAEKTILFDTGTSGEILTNNVKTLNTNLDCVDVIVLSHQHRDYTGGWTPCSQQDREFLCISRFNFLQISARICMNGRPYRGSRRSVGRNLQPRFHNR